MTHLNFMPFMRLCSFTTSQSTAEGADGETRENQHGSDLRKNMHWHTLARHDVQQLSEMQWMQLALMPYVFSFLSSFTIIRLQWVFYLFLFIFIPSDSVGPPCPFNWLFFIYKSDLVLFGNYCQHVSSSHSFPHLIPFIRLFMLCFLINPSMQSG